MSRQTKDNPPEPPTQSNSKLDQLIHNDRFIALQGQIDLCQQQRRQLIQSRNYAIIAAVLAGLTIFYLLFIKTPKDNSGQQQALIARQLAAHKKQLSNRICLPDTILPAALNDNQSIAENANHTISKIQNKLNGKALAPVKANASDDRLSSALSQPTESEVAHLKTPWRERQAISRMLHLWAVAWELKDLTAYFSHYAKNFDPQIKAENLQEWKAKRSYYINKPASIKVTIHDIKIRHTGENTATASFNQHYSTPNYSDKTHKLLELIRQNNRWLILRENSTTTRINFENQ